jgi:hypothetical protein
MFSGSSATSLQGAADLGAAIFSKCYNRNLVAINYSIGMPEWRDMLLRLAARIIQLQFVAVCIYILCDWLAGSNNAILWFVTVSLILFGLTVCGMATRHRKR